MDALATKLKSGDKVVLSFWAGEQTEIEGTVDLVMGCDGNGCEKHAAEGRARWTDEQKDAAMLTDPCGEDYLGIVEDDAMVYFRYQVVEINGVAVPGGGGVMLAQ